MACPWWADNHKELVGFEYRCYVGNLPYGTSESSLQDAASSYGPLSSQIVIDRETGRSRGFGFVQFEDQKSLDDAIQCMNGHQIGGRTVSVSQANQRPCRWKA